MCQNPVDMVGSAGRGGPRALSARGRNLRGVRSSKGPRETSLTGGLVRVCTPAYTRAEVAAEGFVQFHTE